MRESIEIVGSNLGSLLTLFGLCMGTAVIVAVGWGEWYAVPGVLAAATITGGLGQFLVRTTDPDDPSEVYGIVTAAVGWRLADATVYLEARKIVSAPAEIEFDEVPVPSRFGLPDN